MKIRSDSIRSGINEVQQQANTSEPAKTAKEVLPDAKDMQAVGKFAANIKSEQTLTGTIRANELQKTFAQIKTNPGLVEQNETNKAIISAGDKMKLLTDKLKSLAEQKAGLVKQILDLAAQIAGVEFDGKKQSIAEAQAQLQQLKSELAKVEVEIKELMNEIEKLKQQEQEEKDRIKSQEEQKNNLLDKAADSFKSMLNDITKLFP
jgi:chromosome segregation ATPase